MNKMALLVAAWLVAAPVHAMTDCYQQSNLSMFSEVVEVIAADQMNELGCWHLRLRLRGGPADPFGHAMICRGNGCHSDSDLVEGIYWLKRSPRNQNIGQVVRLENGSCTDVSFCIAPADESQVMWVDFVALFEESYFLPPAAFRPRWSRGRVGFASFDGRSHCQDDERRGSVCLEQ